MPAGEGVVAKARLGELLGRNGAPGLRIPLDHLDAPTGPGEVGRRDEPVGAASDDDRVDAAAPGVPAATERLIGTRLGPSGSSGSNPVPGGSSGSKLVPSGSRAANLIKDQVRAQAGWRGGRAPRRGLARPQSRPRSVRGKSAFDG